MSATIYPVDRQGALHPAPPLVSLARLMGSVPQELEMDAPEPPSLRSLPLAYQQEVARRRLAFALVGLLASEVLIALALLPIAPIDDYELL
jgi:hypothetical protein